MGLVSLVQGLLKARPSSWVGGFAQGLSGCILWVSRGGPTMSSLTHPQHCQWHHAQTALTSRLLSSSLPASQEMLSCHVLLVPPSWPSPQLCPCPWCWQSIARPEHGAHLALRRVPAVPRSLVTSPPSAVTADGAAGSSAWGQLPLNLDRQASKGFGFVISGIMGIN